MGIQVQLRGGTTKEHENFIGANKEVTVDTTKHTLVVHDGAKKGGYPLVQEAEVDRRIYNAIRDIKPSTSNIDLSNYVKKGANEGLLLQTIYEYKGLIAENGDNVDYIRTTKSGLLPFSPGNSSIGSSAWRFAQSFINVMNTSEINIGSSKLKQNGNQLEINTPIKVPYIEIGSKRIYIGSSFPSDARTGDILIQA